MKAWVAVGLLVLGSSLARSEEGEGRFFAPPKPLPAGAVTEDWPRLLGPQHQATSGETKLLHTWPASGPKLVWEYPKGLGFGGPALAEGKLVLFHRLEGNEVVDGLEAETGKRLWRHTYAAPYQDRFGAGDGPRNSPVIAEGHVFTCGISGQLYCLELATGQVVWHRDCAQEDKLAQNFFGHGSTPLVLGHQLIINLGGEDDLCVAAFDTATGKVLWQLRHPWGASYASPVPATIHGKECVLIFAGGESRPPTGGLLCIEVSTGKLLAAVPYRSEIPESVNAASPVVVNGTGVFLTDAYGTGGGLVSLEPDFASAAVKWKAGTFNAQFITPVQGEGCIFGSVSGNPQLAELVALDAKTGEELWRDDLGGKLGRLNLLKVDGAYLALGEFGELLWLDLTRKGVQVQQRAKLFHAPETWTLPAISHGLLYVCQHGPSSSRTTGRQPPRLLCYDLRGE